MVHQNKFFIIENIEGNEGVCYERMWILEQILNRPYFMRVTYYSEVTTSFQKGMDGGQSLVRSLASMKNFLQQTDRQTEMSIALKAGSMGGSNDTAFDSDQNEGSGGYMRANIQSNNIIGDALDLIEEDNVMQDGDTGHESSDDDSKSKQSAKPAQV